VSSDSTVVFGWRFFHSFQVVVTTYKGRSSMPWPTNAPTTGVPLSVDHIDLVAWSYISLFERYRKPLVPSSCCTPLTRVSYRIIAPHSVQYTPFSSRPAMRSLTISCQR
jgi:hypothetical protein